MFKRLKNKFIAQIADKIVTKMHKQPFYDILKTQIGDKDTIIINYKHPLGEEEFKHIKNQLANLFFPNKTLILEGDVDITVLTKKQIDEAI